MSIVRLSFLGPIQFSRADQSVDLSIAKAQALLAYLAATGEAQRRDHLLDLLWAESHSDAARKNLRNRLWLIRQAFGEDVLITEGDSVQLAEGVWSDVHAFSTGADAYLRGSTEIGEQLQSLIDLWRGPFLHGLKLSEAPDFELWLTTERERLGQRYLRIVSLRIAQHRANADWSAIIPLAQRALAYDPSQETMHQHLMLAYAQQGARSEALRQFDHLRTILLQELGVEPDAKSEALRLSILQGDGLGVRNEESLMPHSEFRPQHAKLGQTQPFVGRQGELDLLDHSYGRAKQGQRQLVVMNGELGIGKTRLWQVWSERLSPHPLVLETRCLIATQSLPFDPLIRLLNRPICRQQFAAISSTLLPAWRNELLRLAPTLQERVAANEPFAGPSGVEDRGRLAEALVQFLRSFGGAPLVFFIDDLHWADQATLDWLSYLIDRMAEEPLFLVGAYRTEDAPDGLLRTLAQWQREGTLQRLTMPHLTQQQTTELLAALGGKVAMANYLYMQSGGNPYYLTQLSGLVVDGVPAELAELVRVRLTQLPGEAQQVLQAAAVLEPNIDIDILQRTSQRNEEETLDALDALLAAAVLVERETVYEFTHPLVASVVRDGLSSARRKILHRRVAEALTYTHRQNPAAVAGQLARHFSEAGVHSEAALYAELAGDQALQIAAMIEAAAFYRHAYELEPTPNRLLGLGRALTYTPGQMSEARTALQSSLVEFERQHDQLGVVKAGIWLALSYLVQEEGEQVLYWAKRILPDLETVTDVDLHARAQYLLGTAKFRGGYSMDEAVAHYAEAVHLVTAHHLSPEIAIMSRFEWGNLRLQQGNFQQAVEQFSHTRTLAQVNNGVLYEALSNNNLAYATLMTGDTSVAKTIVEEGLSFANKYALFSMFQYLYSTRGEIARAAGNFDEAEASFNRALLEAEKHDSVAFAANVRANLGLLAQARGRLDEAHSLLMLAREAVTGETARHLQIQVDLWLAELHLVRGEYASAAEALTRAEVHLDDGKRPKLQMKLAEIRAKFGAMTVGT